MEVGAELQGLDAERVVSPVLGPLELAIAFLTAAPMGHDRVVVLFFHEKCPGMSHHPVGAQPDRQGSMGWVQVRLEGRPWLRWDGLSWPVVFSPLGAVTEKLSRRLTPAQIRRTLPM